MEPSTLDGGGRPESSAIGVDPADGRSVSDAGSSTSPPVVPEPALGATPDSLPGVSTVRGTRLIMAVAVIAVLTILFNFAMAKRNETNEKQRAAETELVNDQTLTKQSWTNADDGLIATFVSVDGNDENVARIRSLLKFRRTEYLRANYSDPRFGNTQIDGRADLEFGTANKKLNCRYRDIPGGGELRWITTDPIMLDSLNDWAGVVAVPPFVPSSAATTG